MKLLWSPRSPFVRKVMILLHELGRVDEVELIRAVAVPRGQPNPEIMSKNPLGRIPVLLRAGKEPVLESGQICECLAWDFEGGEALVPHTGEAREIQMRWQALGDGLMENLLLYRIEKTGAAGGDEQRLVSLGAKVTACFSTLNEDALRLAQTPFGIGQIAVICALGQADFRFADSAWRQRYPALAQWHLGSSERASIRATAIKNDVEEPVQAMELKI